MGNNLDSWELQIYEKQCKVTQGFQEDTELTNNFFFLLSFIFSYEIRRANEGSEVSVTKGEKRYPTVE